MKQGRRIIAVTLNAPDDWNDHKYLFEKGFSEFSVRDLVFEGECLGNVWIAGGTEGSVELIAENGFSFAMREDENWHLELPQPEFVYAPVVQGQNAGYAHIYVDDIAVGKIPLVYGHTVEQNSVPDAPWWKRLFIGE